MQIGCSPSGSVSALVQQRAIIIIVILYLSPIPPDLYPSLAKTLTLFVFPFRSPWGRFNRTGSGPRCLPLPLGCNTDATKTRNYCSIKNYGSTWIAWGVQAFTGSRVGEDTGRPNENIALHQQTCKKNVVFNGLPE